jgi:tetratricopeptide (TPR) repeat protein
MARLAYLDAAAYFAEAAELLPASMASRSLDYRQQQTSALFQYGEEQGDNVILGQAIETYKSLLKSYTRDLTPLDWAMTQNNLGIALLRLGERENGTERLEEAVTACKAALEEYRRERVPLQWATTQNNLGLALATVGKRNKDKSCLTQARAAIEQAFSVFRDAGYQQYNEDFGQRLDDLDQTLDSL